MQRRSRWRGRASRRERSPQAVRTRELDVAWAALVAAKRAEELDRIIAEEGLDPEAIRAFGRGSILRWCRATDRHSDHPDPPAGLLLRTGRRRRALA